MALPEGIKIRDARRGDRDSIYRLLQELGVVVLPAEQSNTLSWVVEHPETDVNLAVDPLDRGIGLLVLSFRPELRVGGRIATIGDFVVTAPMRRKGIGTELLERGLARARSLDCKRVELATDAASRAFLEKRGFSTDGSQVMAWRNAAVK